MTRKDLTNMLHKTLGLNFKESGRIVDKFFDIIVKNLAAGKDVKLSKFGSLKIQDRESRPGRNPTTGEQIQISQRKAIVFRPSKVLRKKINESSEEVL
tara:strand:+ start:641 stop:934 length:294 start_codon:yes stop_codon:yes gene_type:complete